MTGLSTSEVARLSGASLRQLNYWVRTGALVPSITVGLGPGTRHSYSADDARLARLFNELVPAAGYYGMSHQGKVWVLRCLLRDAFRARPSAPYFVIRDGEDASACDTAAEVVTFIASCRVASVICAGTS